MSWGFGCAIGSARDLQCFHASFKFNEGLVGSEIGSSVLAGFVLGADVNLNLISSTLSQPTALAVSH